MKKIISVLLAVLLLAGLCGTAFADDTVYTEGYFYYTVEDGAITIVGYFGNETEVTIPASIAGVPVNAVAPAAFAGTSVTKVNLPDTVTSYTDSEGGRVEVVLDANTDHPYSLGEREEVNPGNAEEVVQQAEEIEIDLNAIEQRDQLLESVAPSPAVKEEPTEALTTATFEEQMSEPAEEAQDSENDAIQEKTAETETHKGASTATVAFVLVGAAIVLGIVLLVIRKRRHTKA